MHHRSVPSIKNHEDVNAENRSMAVPLGESVCSFTRGKTVSAATVITTRAQTSSQAFAADIIA